MIVGEVASALGDTFIDFRTLSPEAQWARILPMLRSLPVEQRMEAMGMANIGWWGQHRFNRTWELGPKAGHAPVYVEADRA